MMLARSQTARLSRSASRATPVSRTRVTKAMAYKVTLKTPSGALDRRGMPLAHGGIGQGGGREERQREQCSLCCAAVAIEAVVLRMAHPPRPRLVTARTPARAMDWIPKPPMGVV